MAINTDWNALAEKAVRMGGDPDTIGDLLFKAEQNPELGMTTEQRMQARRQKITAQQELAKLSNTPIIYGAPSENVIVATRRNPLNAPPLKGSDSYHVQSVQDSLRAAMWEETVAGDWYRRRATEAAGKGDAQTSALFLEIANDEDDHFRQYKERLEQLMGRNI